MRNLPLSVVAAAAMQLATHAGAKLPAPSDAERAKAAETAAKAAWTGKVATFKLCKAQDKAVADHRAALQKRGKTAATGAPGEPCVDPGPAQAPATAQR